MKNYVEKMRQVGWALDETLRTVSIYVEGADKEKIAEDSRD